MVFIYNNSKCQEDIKKSLKKSSEINVNKIAEDLKIIEVVGLIISDAAKALMYKFKDQSMDSIKNNWQDKDGYVSLVATEYLRKCKELKIDFDEVLWGLNCVYIKNDNCRRYIIPTREYNKKFNMLTLYFYEKSVLDVLKSINKIDIKLEFVRTF